MKKHTKAKQTSLAKRSPRLLAAALLLTISVLTMGVVAGISKQKFRAQEANKQAASIAVTNTANAHLANGQSVAVQTGQIKPLTPEEVQKLAAALKELANQSTDGLQQVQHADGSVSVDLQGRFQNVAIAKRNEDGSVSQSCVDNPASGAAFFGIDPGLVGAKAKSGATASSAVPSSK